MKVNFAHLCDYANITADGKVNIMGLFTHIFGVKLPFIHLRAHLVFEIELHYTEVGTPFDVQLECVDADGNNLMRGKTQITVQGVGKPGDRPIVPQVLTLPPLKFVKPGPHDLNIFLGPRSGASISLSFEVTELPQAPPQLPAT